MTGSFTCPRCGMTSHNPNDVWFGYCGNCHDFTGDTGLSMMYDTLVERGHDARVVRQRLGEYEGDFWFELFGPAMDRVERLLFTEDEIDRAVSSEEDAA